MKIKIYLSSFDYTIMKEYKRLKPESELNILLSYATTNYNYYKMIIEERHLISSLILDSGAYTLNNADSTNQKEISLESFKDYCLVLKDKFDFIFNFDEDFTRSGYEINKRNQEILEKAGVQVVPVVHDYKGRESKELNEYIKSYDLIALGFSDDKKNSKVLKNTVQKIKDAGKKVHLLGVSSYDRLKDLPADYCDSSNWAQAQVFGFMYYWDESDKANNPEKKFRFNDYEPRLADNIPYFEDFSRRDEVEAYLKNELGIKYRDLYGHNSIFFVK